MWLELLCNEKIREHIHWGGDTKIPTCVVEQAGIAEMAVDRELNISVK